MRYWGIFGAKLFVICLFLRGLWLGLEYIVPPPAAFLFHHFKPFGHDLKWTALILL